MIAAAKNARGPSLEEFKCNHEWALRDRLKCFVNLESVPCSPSTRMSKINGLRFSPSSQNS
jgi:hypothetical protein